MITGIPLFTIVVREYDEAIRFYVGVLGLTLLEDSDRGQGKRWVRVGAPGGAAILLARAANPHQASRVGDQTGGRVGVFMHCDDCGAEVERLRGAGVKFREGPRHEAYGTVAVFEDLYGNAIDLIGPARGV